MAEQWSILIFGIGILIAAMTYVEGASVWSWIRSNLLFGVFGVSTYLLAPAILYIAVLVAIGMPMKKKTLQILLCMALVSGVFLVFSKTDMTGLSFQDGMIALHQAGASTPWSAGVLGAVFGWSLLSLCGRPGADILLVILLLVGVMLVTGVTPGHIYYYCSGQARRAREKSEERAQMRAERARQMAAEREERREQESVRKQTDFAIDLQAFQNAAEHKRTPSIDIELGEQPVTQIGLKQEERPVIGPGGTFGIEPDHPVMPVTRPSPASDTQPLTSSVKASDEKPAHNPVQDETEQGQEILSVKDSLDEAEQDDIASLVRKVTGAVQNKEAVKSVVSPQPKTDDDYVYPPLSLFQKVKVTNEEDIERELTHNADLLVKTLTSFGVKTRLLDISRGPSVTRYELQPQTGVKISRITGLADDIALNLATSGVRIEAPIPGKAAVGIEIPNKTRTIVTLRSILESPEFSTSTAPLTFAIGKDIAGKSQIGNLAKMPHLLIAGTTGSGKSVCTNSIIMSLLYRCSPQMLRMILIDPKMVEFAQYNGIPHLLMPVVTEPRKAAGALGSAVAEMEKRYRLLAENGVPNIEEYNALAEENATLEKMPYIVIVIDELADLMMVAGKEVEDYICRIAQKARAAGMHLIIATQRPSVDVITGLIKANIPSRIGLSVMSQVDSRTILDTGGAEKLLGNGDMLYMPVGVNKPVRVQGTFVRSAEIRGVIDFIKKHSSADYNQEMIAEMEKRAVAEKSTSSGSDDNDSRDPMLDTAVEVVIDAGQASTSLLQRRCKLGYARAARIIDEMEQMNIIGPYEGAKPRQVLITRDQWIEMRMQRDSDQDPSVV
ncbi:DNA translocase FtsK [uncultured Ruthenibacterium sp.]|uniref:DNA translocase FtsK n=1 Tax=uncultured Ruthenibacterium sp. TaxID=1905347 RepID=UPI00349E4C6F